jgi:hypothetical protein
VASLEECEQPHVDFLDLMVLLERAIGKAKGGKVRAKDVLDGFDDLLPDVKTFKETVEQDGKPVEVEYKVRKFDGKPKHVSATTQALIYVVDASDRGQIDAAAEQLRELLVLPMLDEASVLVLANKQDAEPTDSRRNKKAYDAAIKKQLGHAKPMEAAEVTDVMRLFDIQGHRWYVQESTVKGSTDGEVRKRQDAHLLKGLDWLSQNLPINRGRLMGASSEELVRHEQVIIMNSREFSSGSSLVKGEFKFAPDHLKLVEVLQTVVRPPKGRQLGEYQWINFFAPASYEANPGAEIDYTEPEGSPTDCELIDPERAAQWGLNARDAMQLFMNRQCLRMCDYV